MTIAPGDTVLWQGSIGTVIGVMYEPCAIVEWPNEARTTVGLSLLEKVEVAPVVPHEFKVMVTVPGDVRCRRCGLPWAAPAHWAALPKEDEK